MRLLRFLRRWLLRSEPADGWTEADHRRAADDAEAAAITASWRRRSIPGVTAASAEDARWPLAVRPAPSPQRSLPK